MKSCIACDITPSSPIKSTDVSEEYLTSIFRCRRIHQARKLPEAGGKESERNLLEASLLSRNDTNALSAGARAL
jgi:hypothetical protein